MHIYWNEEFKQYGYWLDEGRTWVPCDMPIRHE